ncbi:MAG: Veg family protein [Tissierellia bacterium]|nr:Veg family protein [Tissierellia bacterium]
MKYSDNLSSIKAEVKENIGKKVILRADKGRKRIVTNEGIIVDAYPNIFIVRINNKFDIERTISYSYSDILTSTVELKIC